MERPRPMLRMSISSTVARDGLEFVFFERFDGAQIGEVLVVAGEVEEQVGGGAQADALEERGAIGPDAFDILHLRAEQLNRGFRRRGWRSRAGCGGDIGHKIILEGRGSRDEGRRNWRMEFCQFCPGV